MSGNGVGDSGKNNAAPELGLLNRTILRTSRKKEVIQLRRKGVQDGETASEEIIKHNIKNTTATEIDKALGLKKEGALNILTKVGKIFTDSIASAFNPLNLLAFWKKHEADGVAVPSTMKAIWTRICGKSGDGKIADVAHMVKKHLKDKPLLTTPENNEIFDLFKELKDQENLTEDQKKFPDTVKGLISGKLNDISKEAVDGIKDNMVKAITAKREDRKEKFKKITAQETTLTTDQLEAIHSNNFKSPITDTDLKYATTEQKEKLDRTLPAAKKAHDDHQQALKEFVKGEATEVSKELITKLTEMSKEAKEFLETLGEIKTTRKTNLKDIANNGLSVPQQQAVNSLMEPPAKDTQPSQEEQTLRGKIAQHLMDSQGAPSQKDLIGEIKKHVMGKQPDPQPVVTPPIPPSKPTAEQIKTQVQEKLEKALEENFDEGKYNTLMEKLTGTEMLEGDEKTLQEAYQEALGDQTKIDAFTTAMKAYLEKEPRTVEEEEKRSDAPNDAGDPSKQPFADDDAKAEAIAKAINVDDTQKDDIKKLLSRALKENFEFHGTMSGTIKGSGDGETLKDAYNTLKKALVEIKTPAELTTVRITDIQGKYKALIDADTACLKAAAAARKTDLTTTIENNVDAALKDKAATFIEELAKDEHANKAKGSELKVIQDLYKDVVKDGDTAKQNDLVTKLGNYVKKQAKETNKEALKTVLGDLSDIAFAGDPKAAVNNIMQRLEGENPQPALTKEEQALKTQYDTAIAPNSSDRDKKTATDAMKKHLEAEFLFKLEDSAEGKQEYDKFMQDAKTAATTTENPDPTNQQIIEQAIEILADSDADNALALLGKIQDKVSKIPDAGGKKALEGKAQEALKTKRTAALNTALIDGLEDDAKTAMTGLIGRLKAKTPNPVLTETEKHIKTQYNDFVNNNDGDIDSITTFIKTHIQTEIIRKRKERKAGLADALKEGLTDDSAKTAIDTFITRLETATDLNTKESDIKTKFNNFVNNGDGDQNELVGMIHSYRQADDLSQKLAEGKQNVTEAVKSINDLGDDQKEAALKSLRAIKNAPNGDDGQKSAASALVAYYEFSNGDNADKNTDRKSAEAINEMVKNINAILDPKNPHITAEITQSLNDVIAAAAEAEIHKRTSKYENKALGQRLVDTDARTLTKKREKALEEAKEQVESLEGIAGLEFLRGNSVLATQIDTFAKTILGETAFTAAAEQEAKQKALEVAEAALETEKNDGTDAQALRGARAERKAAAKATRSTTGNLLHWGKKRANHFIPHTTGDISAETKLTRKFKNDDNKNATTTGRAVLGMIAAVEDIRKEARDKNSHDFTKLDEAMSNALQLAVQRELKRGTYGALGQVTKRNDIKNRNEAFAAAKTAVETFKETLEPDENKNKELKEALDKFSTLNLSPTSQPHQTTPSTDSSKGGDTTVPDAGGVTDTDAATAGLKEDIDNFNKSNQAKENIWKKSGNGRNMTSEENNEYNTSIKTMKSNAATATDAIIKYMLATGDNESEAYKALKDANTASQKWLGNAITKRETIFEKALTLQMKHAKQEGADPEAKDLLRNLLNTIQAQGDGASGFNSKTLNGKVSAARAAVASDLLERDIQSFYQELNDAEKNALIVLTERSTKEGLEQIKNNAVISGMLPPPPTLDITDDYRNLFKGLSKNAKASLISIIKTIATRAPALETIDEEDEEGDGDGNGTV